MNTIIKKGLFAAAVLAITGFSVNELYSYGWGRGGPHWKNGEGNYSEKYNYHHGKAFRHLEYMKEELGLSEKQVKQIFDLGTKYREKYFENRGNYEEIDKLRKEHRKEIENVLTEAQKKKFNEFRGHGKFGMSGGCAYR